MKMAPTALLALCLLAAGGSFAAAELVASVQSEVAFAAHAHSPAFLGFMQQHGKNYCGDHTKACEISVLRCAYQRSNHPLLPSRWRGEGEGVW